MKRVYRSRGSGRRVVLRGHAHGIVRWVALLVDEDDSLRERAAISLGAIGDPAAIDTLASVLLNDGNADVRRQAARSLGLIAAGG